MTDDEREFFGKVRELCEKYGASVFEDNVHPASDVHTIFVRFRETNNCYSYVNFEDGFCRDDIGQFRF